MRNDFSSWSSHDFVEKRLIHKSIYHEELECLLQDWMFFEDVASETYGLVKHVLKDNRFFQLSLCNCSISDGIYEFDSLLLKKVFMQKSGNTRLDSVLMYPGNFNPVSFVADTKDFEDKLIKNGYVTEEEKRFIILLRNMKPKRSDLIKGMIKLRCFNNKEEVK